MKHLKRIPLWRLIALAAVAAVFALSTTDGNTLAFTYACTENLKDAYTDTFKMMVASMQPSK